MHWNSAAKGRKYQRRMHIIFQVGVTIMVEIRRLKKGLLAGMSDEELVLMVGQSHSPVLHKNIFK